MSEKNSGQSRRTIAEIESDLLKAEEIFADADARLRKAERDRRAALDAVNTHQMEFDEAFAALRQRSIPDSKWRLEEQGAEDPAARSDNGEAGAAPRRSGMAPSDRLRAVAPPEEDGAGYPGFRILGPSQT